MLGELVAGAAEGLVLIQDSVSCEGRTLLKSFVAASVRRGESVHVLSFDVPEGEFKAGFTTEVASRISVHDGFQDPLGWSAVGSRLTVGEFSAPQLAVRLSQMTQGPTTVVLDSLSWLLLHLPFTRVCQVLAQLPKKANTVGVKISKLVALLHGDLHQPGQLETLHTLARAVVTLKQDSRTILAGDSAPRIAVTLHRKRRNKKEYFTVLSGFDFKHLGEPSSVGISGEDLENDEFSSVADPTANLTFNLRLSEAERQAKESVPLPYQFSEEKKSSLLQLPTSQGKIYYEPDAADDIDDEDPDDDLDI